MDDCFKAKGLQSQYVTRSRS